MKWEAEVEVHKKDKKPQVKKFKGSRAREKFELASYCVDMLTKYQDNIKLSVELYPLAFVEGTMKEYKFLVDMIDVLKPIVDKDKSFHVYIIKTPIDYRKYWFMKYTGKYTALDKIFQYIPFKAVYLTESDFKRHQGIIFLEKIQKVLDKR